MLNQAFLYKTLDGPLEPEERKLLSELADHVAARWQEPGHSIWEIRTQSHQYVYSKIMCWVALDRAIRLFGAKQHWCQAQDAIYHAVLEKGIAQDQGYLTQTFAGTELDAAVLLTPLLGFPIARSTFEQTVDAIQATLSERGYLKRYQTGDELSGDEGAFLVCNFWLVDALLFLDRREEAVALYEKLLSQTNDVGLLPEELDPKTGAFLGNFPLALSHIGLIRSALTLDLYDVHHLKSEQVFTTDSAHQTTDAMGGLLSSWVTFADAGSSSYDFSLASVLPEFWTY
jgi:GH15 family glucan-1,4-alpha-glucosidase